MFFPLFHKEEAAGNVGRRKEECLKLRLRLMVFKEEGVLQERGRTQPALQMSTEAGDWGLGTYLPLFGVSENQLKPWPVKLQATLHNPTCAHTQPLW